MPSLSAARATLNASIESDLPRSRDERRAPAMCFGATRTTRSPCAIRNRSNAPETCRQSSIAHTRSGSSARAQRSSLPNAPLRAGAVSSPRAAAVSASTAAHVCVRLCVSVPITIICTVPSIELTKRTSGGHVSLGASARLLSGHAGGPRAATGDTTSGRSDPMVDRKSMSQPAASPGTNRSGRTAPLRGALSVRKSRGWAEHFGGCCRSVGRSRRAEIDSCPPGLGCRDRIGAVFAGICVAVILDGVVGVAVRL